ncbi:hypothetical protein EVAR_13507_1 [Eumeta japonica]|uniref:Uncharacterized protein n=1 Tax=Eumeta variegata TaxID=151549 RepID=A0A4C1UZE7_EUMVA|nr:hypothetical protein EVAR_13507_1 [Eumeta japonica]
MNTVSGSIRTYPTWKKGIKASGVRTSYVSLESTGDRSFYRTTALVAAEKLTTRNRTIFSTSPARSAPGRRFIASGRRPPPAKSSQR